MAATEPIYADSSALVKLAVGEPETEALQAFLRADRVELTSSTLAVVEVQRGARIADPITGAQRSRAVLDGIRLLELDRALLEDAVSYTSAHVRSLDAIHLASAIRIGSKQILVYDRRLAEAAAAAGLEVLQPGA
ncbi:MAG: type II toxin-antitoxin system VapC family toxin [Actinobacteria bacterium]|nr:type II toxin-antitoxin system VapC family toxin [Actinomycetota bacterium]